MGLLPRNASATQGNPQRTELPGPCPAALRPGPQEVTRRKGKHHSRGPKAPGLGSPSPTAITGNENRKNQPEGWRSPPLRWPFYRPLSPLPSLPQSVWIPALEGARSADLLDKIRPRDSLSPQASEARDPPPCYSSTLRRGGGDGTTGASGGFSEASFSGLTPPPTKPQTKTTQLLADLQALQELGELRTRQTPRTHTGRAHPRSLPLPAPLGDPDPPQTPDAAYTVPGARSHAQPKAHPRQNQMPTFISAWLSLRGTEFHRPQSEPLVSVPPPPAICSSSCVPHLSNGTATHPVTQARNLQPSSSPPSLRLQPHPGPWPRQCTPARRPPQGEAQTQSAGAGGDSGGGG